MNIQGDANQFNPEKMMPLYAVTWRIDLERDSALDAARGAYETMVDPGHIATIFEVTNLDAPDAKVERIDFGEENPKARPVATVDTHDRLLCANCGKDDLHYVENVAQYGSIRVVSGKITVDSNQLEVDDQGDDARLWCSSCSTANAIPDLPFAWEC